jgi:hypothetical protein
VTDPRVQAEWLNIRAEACHNREVLVASHPDKLGEGFAQQLKLEVASWLDMLKPGIRRRTMIGVVMMFFQQFVGINAVRRGDTDTLYSYSNGSQQGWMGWLLTEPLLAHLLLAHAV